MRRLLFNIAHRYFMAACMVISFCHNGKVFAKANGKIIVVDGAGGADFRSIQEAINSLPGDAHEQRIIYIRNGIGRKVNKNRVSLVVEKSCSELKVIIKPT